MAKGVAEKWKEKVLGENKVESVLQRLDRLTLQESQMTAAQVALVQTETLDVVRGLVDNMRVVMEGAFSWYGYMHGTSYNTHIIDGKASTDGIREALGESN